jgi:hypothetical protein
MEQQLAQQQQQQAEKEEIIQECKNITRASTRLHAKKQQQQQMQQIKKQQSQQKRELRELKKREQEEQILELPFSMLSEQTTTTMQLQEEEVVIHASHHVVVAEQQPSRRMQEVIEIEIEIETEIEIVEDVEEEIVIERVLLDQARMVHQRRSSLDESSLARQQEHVLQMQQRRLDHDLFQSPQQQQAHLDAPFLDLTNLSQDFSSSYQQSPTSSDQSESMDVQSNPKSPSSPTTQQANQQQKRIAPTKVMNRRQMQKQAKQPVRRSLVVQQRQKFQHEQQVQKFNQRQRQRQHQQSGREPRLSPEGKASTSHARGSLHQQPTLETFFCIDLVSLY